MKMEQTYPNYLSLSPTLPSGYGVSECGFALNVAICITQSPELFVAVAA